MHAQDRWSISLPTPAGLMRAFEPTPAQVKAASAQLSAWYDEGHNRTMMANEHDMPPQEVVSHYAWVWKDGGRNFLLEWNGQLMGDADLRHVDPSQGTAEFAIMIGERATQGQGYGTRFAIMLHAWAFDVLALRRLYVNIIPANRGSLRLFEKVGYRRDDSPAARLYMDEPTDVMMSLEPAEFRRLHADTARSCSISLLHD